MGGAGYEDSIQNTGVSIQNNSRKPSSPAIHCPEKSFCVAQNEANHGTHSVFCRENGWISLSRLAGVSGGAVYTYASPVRNEPDGMKSSSPFDGRMRAILVVIAPRLLPALRYSPSAARMTLKMSVSSTYGPKTGSVPLNSLVNRSAPAPRANSGTSELLCERPL